MKIKRSLVVQIMEGIGFDTASALSTQRLEKRINRIDRIEFSRSGLSEDLATKLELILQAIDQGEEIAIEEDRPNVPKVESTKGQQKLGKIKSGGAHFHKTPKPKKYDWDKILGGSILELAQGLDFDCKVHAFAMQVRTAAKRRGVGVKIKVVKDRVYVQADLQKAGK